MTEKPRVRTIADLARIAGVSPGTVSRALTGAGLIAQGTRERIQALAEEHEFRPNQAARNLRIQQAGAVGVVIPLGHERGQHLSDPFFMQLIGHLADELAERGRNLLLSRVIPSGGGWLERILDSGHVDGVIVIGQSDQSATLDRVAAKRRPLVVWGARSPGQVHCTVGSDNRRGGALAGAHLLDQGCRRIAFLGDVRAPEVAQRYDGCQAALAEAGLPAPPSVPVHLTPESAYRDIARYLAELGGERPDGLFAASDVIAMSALRALADHGLSVPGDVRVVGFDDLPLAAQTVPPLTTVRQDLAAGARELVRLVFRRIHGEDTESVQLPTELVVRSSSVEETAVRPG